MAAPTPAGARPAAGETERQILDAVGEIIATEDFDAVSMRRVAAKANVSLSTVVRHFGTKDALLAALVSQGGEDEERDEIRRNMEPGDVAAAVRVVVGDYEEAGQQLMHMLGQEHRFPALSELLDLGRRGHRRWVQVGVLTPARRSKRRGKTQLEDLLVVATDVYTWKLLRIDRRLSARATGAAMTELCEAVVGAMSRFLLATWDGGGTIPPELGLAAELVARGHEVVVLSDDTVEQEAVDAGATFTPWRRAPQARARDAERALIRDWEVKNPLAQVRQVGELLFFGPASLHAADLSDAIDRYSPDVLIVDALLTGASAGAEHSGLPTAAVAPNVNMLRTPGVPPMGSGLRPLGGRVGRMRDAALHRLNDVLMGTGTLNDTRREMGLDPVGSLEQSIRRADRVIFLTSEAFDFTPTSPDPHVVYGGVPIPPSEREPVAWTPPWPQDGRPAVLLSLSTTYMQQEDLLQRLVDALGQVDCHALVTTGPGMRSRPLARVPKQRPRGRVGPARCGAAPRRPGDHPWRSRHGDPVAGRRRAGDGRSDQSRPARQRRACGAPRGRDQGLEAIVTGEVRRRGAACPRRRRPPRRAPAEMAERLAPDMGAPKAIAALEDLAGERTRR